MNNILIKKYKHLLENPDFEQDYLSKTAQGIYKIGYESFRLMKRVIYHDRSDYDNMKYYDLTESICRIA